MKELLRDILTGLPISFCKNLRDYTSSQSGSEANLFIGSHQPVKAGQEGLED